MGGTASPGKQVLKDACAKRNIPSTGSIKQLLHRLERFDEKQKLQSNPSGKISKSSGKVAKKKSLFTTTNKDGKKDTAGKDKQKAQKVKKRACISTPSNPLQMSAQFYIEKHCNNVLARAPPEYVYGSDGKTVKLRVPKVCGSKAGQIVRWVISK